MTSKERDKVLREIFKIITNEKDEQHKRYLCYLGDTILTDYRVMDYTKATESTKKKEKV